MSGSVEVENQKAGSKISRRRIVTLLLQEPIDLMTSGNFQHVPWITGITDDEVKP